MKAPTCKHLTDVPLINEMLSRMFTGQRVILGMSQDEDGDITAVVDVIEWGRSFTFTFVWCGDRFSLWSFVLSHTELEDE